MNGYVALAGVGAAGSVVCALLAPWGDDFKRGWRRVYVWACYRWEKTHGARGGQAIIIRKRKWFAWLTRD